MAIFDISPELLMSSRTNPAKMAASAAVALGIPLAQVGVTTEHDKDGKLKNVRLLLPDDVEAKAAIDAIRSLNIKPDETDKAAAVKENEAREEVTPLRLIERIRTLERRIAALETR